MDKGIFTPLHPGVKELEWGIFHISCLSMSDITFPAFFAVYTNGPMASSSRFVDLWIYAISLFSRNSLQFTTVLRTERYRNSPRKNFSRL